jgi:hypothetical protein
MDSERPYNSKLHEDTDLSRTSADIRFNKLTEGGLNSAIRNPCDAIEPRSLTRKTFDNSSQRDQSPPVLSPADSNSTASSPGNTSNIWVSPETPCRQSDRKIKIEALTPLTPPTTYSVTAKQKIIFTPLQSLVNTNTIFQKIEARIARSSDQNVEEDIAGHGEDEFAPKKLIRGLTAEFQASKS